MKLFIKNRKDQKISVIVEQATNPRGLAFVMHGLGSFKELDQIEAFAAAFREQNFTVVRFDTTNTLGESDGRYEDATSTNYYEDLEDVIAWASAQPWYQEPFVLAGHSLGALSSCLYAEKYPTKILALVPIAVPVSGQLSVEAYKKSDPTAFENWEKTGWREEMSISRPGVMRRLPWSHMADRLKYDLMPEVGKLTMPVLMIVGENDSWTPPEHVKIMYDALPGPKELHIIKNSRHTFRDPQHIEEVKGIIRSWLGTI